MSLKGTGQFVLVRGLLLSPDPVQMLRGRFLGSQLLGLNSSMVMEQFNVGQFDCKTIRLGNRDSLSQVDSVTIQLRDNSNNHETAKKVACFGGMLDNSYPRQVVPRTSRTRDKPYPGQVVPGQVVPGTSRSRDTQ